jgi:hypothetical protein
MGIVYINHIRTTELRTKRDKLWVCGVQRGVRMQWKRMTRMFADNNMALKECYGWNVLLLEEGLVRGL